MNSIIQGSHIINTHSTAVEGGRQRGDRDILWAPYKVCCIYGEEIRQWIEGKKKIFTFWNINDLVRTWKP
jgi:hypothetical protein